MGVTLDTETSVSIDVVSGDDVISTAVSGTATVSNSGVWSITLAVNNLNSGDLDLNAQSVDVAGNTATAQRTISYDPSSLTLTIDDPVSGDNVISSSEESSVSVTGVTAA